MLGHRGIDDDLALAAWAGLAAVVLLLGAGAALLRWDAPLRSAGGSVEGALNKLRRRDPPRTGLPDRLLRERDLIRDVLASRWPAALLATIGRWAFDYVALLLALAAVGAHPTPSAVLLAFCVAQALGLIPLTPGGLGFVEAGLTGTLALAGRLLGRRRRRDARLPARRVLAAAPRRRGRLRRALPDLPGLDPGRVRLTTRQACSLRSWMPV